MCADGVISRVEGTALFGERISKVMRARQGLDLGDPESVEAFQFFAMSPLCSTGTPVPEGYVVTA